MREETAIEVFSGHTLYIKACPGCDTMLKMVTKFGSTSLIHLTDEQRLALIGALQVESYSSRYSSREVKDV